MARMIAKAKTSGVNRAAMSALSSDTSACCRDLDNARGLLEKRSVAGREACRLPAVPRASDLFESLSQNYSESNPRVEDNFPRDALRGEVGILHHGKNHGSIRLRPQLERRTGSAH